MTKRGSPLLSYYSSPSFWAAKIAIEWLQRSGLIPSQLLLSLKICSGIK